MRKILICAAIGAAALAVADSAASGRGQDTVANTIVAQTPRPHVDRTLKGDRVDRPISVRQEALHTPRPRHPGRSMARRPKLLDGCELAVSPLSESAQLGKPARCIS
jgi:hypothetical protein